MERACDRVCARAGVVVAVWLARVRRARPDRHAPVLGRGCCYFGPVWWAIGVRRSRSRATSRRGTCTLRRWLGDRPWPRVRGRWSARAEPHVAARGRGGAALVLLVYVVPLYRSVATGARWPRSRNRRARRRGAALSAPQGSLIVVGAPGPELGVGAAVRRRPPFQRTDLSDRVFIVSPRALSCCRSQWFEETRQALRAWSAGPASGSAVVVAVGSATRTRVSSDGARLPQSAVLARDCRRTLTGIEDANPARLKASGDCWTSVSRRQVI